MCHVRSGLTYTHWGDSACPVDTVLLYSGIIVQAASKMTNLLCIPKDSASSSQPQIGATPTSHITRMEPQVYTNHAGVTDAIPCSLCFVSSQSVVVTFPGNTTCPNDWTRQYHGHLITSYELSTTDILCADEKLSREIKWGDGTTTATRNDLNMVETVCRNEASSCQGYKAGQLMSCVVCSK